MGSAGLLSPEKSNRRNRKLSAPSFLSRSTIATVWLRAQVAIARVTFVPDCFMIETNCTRAVVASATALVAIIKAFQRHSGNNMAGDDPESATASTRMFDPSELQEELHTLGNALAQIKIGHRLLAREDLDPARRREFIEEIDRSIADAESVFRLLSAQLK